MSGMFDKESFMQKWCNKAHEVFTDWSSLIYKGKQVFFENEFVCRCAQKHIKARISTLLMLMLFEARKYADVPFKIMSGCRCEAHNRDMGGKPLSDHLDGQISLENGKKVDMITVGVDVSIANNRFKIIQALMAVGFNRFVFYRNKNIVHVGLDTRNPSEQFIIE